LIKYLKSIEIEDVCRLHDGVSIDRSIAQIRRHIILINSYFDWKEDTKMLNIVKCNENEKMILALEGRLDTITAPQLEAELKTALGVAKELVLDFTKLEYISSAGLRVLLSAQKVMTKQGEMRIVHVNETIMEIFEVTGFSEILTIV